MNIRAVSWIAILVSSGLWGTAVVVRGQDDETPVEPRIRAYDKGPAKIDVSKYPPEVQKAYKTFTVKCMKCHTLARPINCELATADEWEAYMKRMMRKAGSFISPEQGKQIYEFLVYDSQIRKKAMVDKKLKAGGTPGPRF